MNKEPFYNKHYIRIDASGNIVEGWSDGPHNHRTATEEDICINDKGGYQFRLVIDGKPTEVNPLLFDGMSMIPLYRWDGEKVVRRSEEELEAERQAARKEQEKQARLAKLHKALADSDYIAAKIAEGAATREEYADKLAQRQSWRDEINALESESRRKEGPDGRQRSQSCVGGRGCGGGRIFPAARIPVCDAAVRHADGLFVRTGAGMVQA